jgi:hypothetical protein
MQDTEYDRDRLTVARALNDLAALARECGFERVSQLGDVPPYGTPEYREWVAEHRRLAEAKRFEKTRRDWARSEDDR